MEIVNIRASKISRMHTKPKTDVASGTRETRKNRRKSCYNNVTTNSKSF